MGGTKVLAVAVDVDGSVRWEHRIPSPSGDAIVAAIIGLVGTVQEAAGEPLAVGVGLPGLVDRAGVLRFAPHLRTGENLAMRSQLEARLTLPVQVDNDATCAAWAERSAGAARGLDDVVLVTLGTGIGGGIVSGGIVQRGANGFAGEVGHMVVDPDGPQCPCGQRGCWERLASGTALARLARQAARDGRVPAVVEQAGGDPEEVRGEHLTRAAAEGDAGAGSVLDTFSGWVALGLVNLTNLFDPAAIVVGGGLVKLGDLLLDRVRNRLADGLFAADHRPPPPILPAALGERAGAIGAADLARIAMGPGDPVGPTVLSEGGR